jgi:hypothetical protein
MTYNNFTIIENIFDDEDTSGRPSYELNSSSSGSRITRKDGISLEYSNNENELMNLKKINSRTLDSHSARPPYPVSNISDIPSLSYDENMIRNKLQKQFNPRLPLPDNNNFNRILRPQIQPQLHPQLHPQSHPQLQSQLQSQLQPQVQSQVQLQPQISHLHCRNIYEHIEECPVCNKYYKQSNRFYIFIIIILVLFIIFLLRRD